MKVTASNVSAANGSRSARPPTNPIRSSSPALRAARPRGGPWRHSGRAPPPAGSAGRSFAGHEPGTGRRVQDPGAGDRVDLRDEEPPPPRTLTEREHGAHAVVLGRDAREQPAGHPDRRRPARSSGSHPPRQVGDRVEHVIRLGVGALEVGGQELPARTSTPVIPAACAPSTSVRRSSPTITAMSAVTSRSRSASSKYAAAGLPQIAAAPPRPPSSRPAMYAPRPAATPRSYASTGCGACRRGPRRPRAAGTRGSASRT